MNNKKIAMFAMVAAVLAVALFLGLVNAPVHDVQAAPLALTTPVASITAGRQGVTAVFFQGAAETADGGSGLVDVRNVDRMDVHVVIDVGTVNTTTAKLQFSNDGTNWVDGATIASAIVADTNTLTQHATFGRYARVYADVTNTNPITLTIIGLGK